MTNFAFLKQQHGTLTLILIGKSNLVGGKMLTAKSAAPLVFSR
jgi:hypothetical protein